MSEASESGPGPALRAAREALGVSASEVAETLNLPERIIEGIETQEFDELPAAAFTRGYIRAYAKLLELDADQFVRDYDLAAGPNTEPELVVDRRPTSLIDLPQQHPGWVLGGSVVALVIVVIFVLWIVWPQSEPSATAAPNLEAPVAAPAHNAVAEPAPAEVGGTAETVAAVPRAGEAVPEAGKAVPEAADSEAIPDQAALVTPQHRLRFEFSDDCWVEVRDRNGAHIYSDLNRAGQELRLQGEAPFSITLGYAPGVYLEYNDEPVALSPHTRNNVATLVLGQ